MITDTIGVAGIRISVDEDPIYGWRPIVLASPERAAGGQSLAEAFAKELRKKYDLED